jgi:short-subunit dehydrogenase
MKAIIVGATKGMGRAVARRLAESGAELFLLGRNEVELQKSAADLQERGGGERSVGFAALDLAAPDTFEPALKQAASEFGDYDTVIITAGLFGTQEELEADAARTQQLLTVKFSHTVVLCEAFRKELLHRGGGNLVVFSSVAGDRGRKTVVLYGASKAGLSAYLEGLDHKYREQGLNTICVKPGFVRTGMTEGLKEPPFAGEAEQVAKIVEKAIKKGKPVVYAPGIWALVMLVIRSLPRFVMRRVGF